MGLRTFSLERTLLTLGGIEVKGYANGEGISVEFAEEDWAVVSGTHKEVARAQKANNTATMKVRLIQGNPANAWLNDQRTTDTDPETAGTGHFDVVFKDHNSDTEIRSDRAWVSKIPTLAYADEPGVREWEILLTNPSIKLGEITD